MMHEKYVPKPRSEVEQSYNPQSVTFPAPLPCLPSKHLNVMLQTLQHRHGHPLPISQRRELGNAGLPGRLPNRAEPLEFHPSYKLVKNLRPEPSVAPDHHVQPPGAAASRPGVNIPGGDTAGTVPSSLLEGPQLASEHPRAAEDGGKRFESFVSPRDLSFSGRGRQQSSGSGRWCGFWKCPPPTPRAPPSFVGNPAASTGDCEMLHGWKSPILPRVFKQERKSELRDLPRASPSFERAKSLLMLQPREHLPSLRPWTF